MPRSGALSLHLQGVQVLPQLILKSLLLLSCALIQEAECTWLPQVDGGGQELCLAGGVE